MQLDFDVPDLDEAEIEVLALGARKADLQPGSTYRVDIHSLKSASGSADVAAGVQGGLLLHTFSVGFE